jgi:starch synthase
MPRRRPITVTGSTTSSMRIAFVTSEVSPFSKTGGLADVSAALPAALVGRGLEVTVFSPLYRSAAAALAQLDARIDDVRGPVLWIGDEQHAARYRALQIDGCRFVFVADDAFYDRAGPYVGPGGGEYADNVARFAFLCRAALEYCLEGGEVPDVFHLNDWPTSLIPVYLQTLYRRPALAGARSLFTLHNLAYQGRYAPPQLYATGLDWSVFHPGALEFYGMLNLLKGGLVFADALTTVSPSYAEEIQLPAFGNGLDGVLRAARSKLSGILNGIDTRRWNPAADPLLPARFRAADLRGKAVCKRALQERLRLPVRGDALLLGAISRFDVQKGIPLIADAWRIVAPLPLQLVVLGSGDGWLEQRVRDLAAADPQQVAASIGFDESLAHLIEAGADAFLMPSAFEPCGLSQMYSQRYGTVPIVHATGGLKDTVLDTTPARLAAGTASGFSFDRYDAAHLADAILRAQQLYAGAPDAWRRLQRFCMALDHSWDRRAVAYVDQYTRLVAGDG